MRRGGEGKENRGLNPSLGDRKREEAIGMQRQKRGREEQKKRKRGENRVTK